VPELPGRAAQGLQRGRRDLQRVGLLPDRLASLGVGIGIGIEGVEGRVGRRLVRPGDRRCGVGRLVCRRLRLVWLGLGLGLGILRLVVLVVVLVLVGLGLLLVLLVRILGLLLEAVLRVGLLLLGAMLPREPARLRARPPARRQKRNRS
jgi:hypothetical protein